MWVRLSALLFSVLLGVDGVLAIIDCAPAIQQTHYSFQTSIALTLLCLPVFVTSLALTSAFKSTLKWPLLLSSGYYSIQLVLGVSALYLLAWTHGRTHVDMQLLSAATWRLLNLACASLQLIVSSVCILGALRGGTRRQIATQAA